MIKSNFFKKKKEYLTIASIIAITNAKITKDIDLSLKVLDINILENASSNQISFLSSSNYLDKLVDTKAGICLIEEKYSQRLPHHVIGLFTANPYFAYSQISSEFYEEIIPEFSNQNIHSSVVIGKNTRIANNAYIGKNVKIGDNCLIYPNVTIMDGCSIGDNCTIHSNSSLSFCEIKNNCIIHQGVRIGQDGFGFAHDKGINHKIIQLGIVKIGNDVEIGANTCIDRGAIENTEIADQVKIDNLCQIAHNVKIGQGTVMAGCSAIAGSTIVGKYVQIAGGCCVGGHIVVGDMAKIAGMSGVMRDVASKEIVAGSPAIPIKKWHRINAQLIASTQKK
ncbi:UDP-3-O-acylglucosamine N-acyltransferase [Alphaproteobacteria bacterium]|nr:UDP-3-O-acylglucosamine N-acyltransferase [Alphaproteobacteria bacterium]